MKSPQDQELLPPVSSSACSNVLRGNALLQILLFVSGFSSLWFSSYINNKQFSISFLVKHCQQFTFMETHYPQPFTNDPVVQQKQPVQLRSERQKRNTVTAKRQLLRRRYWRGNEICSLIKTHFIQRLLAEAGRTRYFTTQLLCVHSINGKKILLAFRGKNECSVPCLFATVEFGTNLHTKVILILN